MPKEISNKRSSYDQLPGLREANKGGKGTAEGPVKSALRKLDFESGQQSLAPAPEKPGPLSPVKNPVLRDKLSQHLVSSGRSNGAATTSKLGGERSKEADTRRDAHAKTVLKGMEEATQDNQQKTPKDKQLGTPLTHAYSAHGPESDQVGRLVHGRRADEKGPSGKPETTLTGNSALGDYKTPAHDTVGESGSNTSGAFRDHFSMLRVVNEAFAQVGQVDRYASDKRGKNESTVVDQERFATTIDMGKDAVGYNLSVSGHSKQSSKIPLAKDEMEARYKSIVRDDSMTSATVVLDPSFNEKGQRVGWNLQTAYANKNAASDAYAQPSDVGGKIHEKIALVDNLKKQIEALKPQEETLGKELNKAKGLVKGKEQKLNGMKGALAKKRGPLDTVIADTNAPAEEVELAKKTLAELEQRVSEAQVELDEANKGVKDAQDAYDKVTQPLETARGQLVTAEKDLKSYRESQKKGGSGGASDEEGGQSEGGNKGPTPDAGYDPVKGIWTGDRPEKPAEYASELKGLDKDGKALTAHHLYPWNKIMADLNAALLAKSKSGLERIFTFGGVTVDDDFWTELAKEPADRNYAFAEALNLNMGKICWSPSNVMMGPGSRKDDPGEEVDAKFGPKGLPTPQSAMAELFARQGGIHKGGGLANYMLAAMRQGGVGHADAYDPKDWGYEGDKPFLKQPEVSEKDGKRVDQRSKWVFEANPKHGENQANIPVKDRVLTGKVPKLVSPTREANKAHFTAPDTKGKGDDKKKGKGKTK